MICLVVSVLALARTARADCREPTPGQVVCDKESFTLLYKAALDGEAAPKKAKIEAEKAAADLADARAVTAQCQKALASVPVPPDPKRLMLGYGLGVIGAAALTVTPFLPVSLDGKFITAAAGFVGVSTGYLLVVHF